MIDRFARMIMLFIVGKGRDFWFLASIGINNGRIFIEQASKIHYICLDTWHHISFPGTFNNHKILPFFRSLADTNKVKRLLKAKHKKTTSQNNMKIYLKYFCDEQEYFLVQRE